MHAENPCKVQSSPTALPGLQARTSVLNFPVSSKGCGGGKETGLEWAEKELCDRPDRIQLHLLPGTGPVSCGEGKH